MNTYREWNVGCFRFFFSPIDRTGSWQFVVRDLGGARGAAVQVQKSAVVLEWLGSVSVRGVPPSQRWHGGILAFSSGPRGSVLLDFDPFRTMLSAGERLPWVWRMSYPIWLGWGVGALCTIYFLAAFCRGPFRRARRRRAGQCTRCGYLLLGLAERRCPECGTAAPPDSVSRYCT
jgi:hypothetical protein